jgi:hypothetical protein
MAEKEACLRLKGENGLLRKKFDEQQKSIDDTKAMLRSADSDKRQLNVVGGVCSCGCAEALRCGVHTGSSAGLQQARPCISRSLSDWLQDARLHSYRRLR